MLTSPQELKVGDLISICETVTRHSVVKINSNPFGDTPDFRIIEDAQIKRQLPLTAGIPLKVVGIALPMIMLECMVEGIFQQLPPVVFVNCNLTTFCVIPKHYARKYIQYFQDRGLAGCPQSLDKSGQPIEQLSLVDEDENDEQAAENFLLAMLKRQQK